MSGTIVLPGGSGHLGTLLARALWRSGKDVVVLSRNPHPAPWRTAPWDGTTLGDWTSELEGAAAVIHLSGRNVNCRYGWRNRAAIRSSRVVSTRVLGRAIAGARRPPRVWLQASTATIYAHRYDAPHDEATGVLGGEEPGLPETWRFSIDVARAWECELDEADTPATRKVKLRSAVVLSPVRGAAFDVVLRLVRLGLGGRSGDGRQYVSWIHDEDFVRAVDWLLSRDTLAGAVNVASPHPLPNVEFMRTLRRAWGRRIGLPAPRPVLELGALLLRSETELILKSRRVVPGLLERDGFVFRFPRWEDAAADLCRRWREDRAQRRTLPTSAEAAV